MADFINNSDETLGFDEAVVNAPAQSFAESIGLRAFYPATPYFVGSDLGLYNEALSATAVAEFIRSRSPIGYSPFRDFVAGEYKFQKGYVSFVFKPLDGADARLSLVDAKITADVPDRTESNTGTITDASTGLAVTFATPFAVAPQVIVTPVLTSVPVVPVLVSAPTTTGFTVKLFNLTGTAVTGTFFWAAAGY